MATNIYKNPLYIQWKENMLQKQRPELAPKKESAEQQQARIDRARSDYGYFVKTYFGDIASCACAKFQVDAAKYLLKNRDTRAVFEWARGHAKSTHLGVFIPLWLKCQKEKEINTVVVVSKSQESARKLLSDLQEQLEFNELYIKDFGAQVKNGWWADGEFVTKDDTFFIALGRGQSPRGLKHKGNRPDYIVIDDIDDDEMCRNSKRVKETVEWCLTALFGTMSAGRGRFVCVGNKISKTSVLAELSKREGTYHTQVNILNKNGIPSWKENYSLQEVERMHKYIGERNFQKEYMNNPITEGAVFTSKNINYGTMLPIKEYRQLICYTDPSFKNTTTSDYKATALVGKTTDGYYHLIKMFADITSVSNMIDWHYQIYDYVAGRVPVMYYMEANFMQDLFMDEFRKVGEMRGYHIPIIGDKRGKGDKFARIESMQPLFERNMVLLNEKERDSKGMKVLEEQLLMFERGSRAHDDAPDALESAIWMLAQRTRVTNNDFKFGKRTNWKW
ncbi:MAG: phage terminase large subunit [Prevotellaceae bacterium]|jgi:predicted phage terminase large subunit-like protein|nr:phage terminase large subunit [Prevotellaceae bacterium]